MDCVTDRPFPRISGTMSNSLCAGEGRWRSTFEGLWQRVAVLRFRFANSPSWNSTFRNTGQCTWCNANVSNKCLWILTLLCALRAVGAEQPSNQAQTGSKASQLKPNIIFILADDLGYGDLGCYGQTKIKTPNLDKLAAEGMRFTDFYAGSPVCAPSRCSLMTGLHTGHSWIRGNGSQALRPEDTTIAELLKAAGYHTGLIGKWGLGNENTSGLPQR